jgi:hypothetical protein
LKTDAPFTHIECATGAELNAQFRAAGVAGLAHLPEGTASCDYSGISARNP